MEGFAHAIMSFALRWARDARNDAPMAGAIKPAKARRRGAAIGCCEWLGQKLADWAGPGGAPAKGPQSRIAGRAGAW
jgi:hypothetical protein